MALSSREAALLRTILENPGLGQLELLKKVDTARETLRKTIRSLSEKNLIVNRGGERQGMKDRWFVNDAAMVAGVLGEESSRVSIAEGIEKGRITTVQIPFSKVVDEVRPRQDADLNKLFEAALPQDLDTAPLVKINIVNYNDTPVPNSYVGNCTKQLVRLAYILPFEQLKNDSRHYSQDECMDILSKSKYSVIINVDYTNMSNLMMTLLRRTVHSPSG